VEQRQQIAHELHDVLAHGLAVSIRQAEAGLARLDSEPDKTRATLESIAAAGRHSLEDVRRLLTLLRQPADASLEPTTGLDGVRDLAERLTAAGLRVDVHLDLDPDDVPPGLALAVHRIVQESLTNALRHGAATHAVVRVAREAGGLFVDVADDGRGHPGEPEAGGGLTGMRERAAMFGGDVATSSAPGAGFRVRVSLPLASA
jgi:signal transduction histidine kinase